MNFNWWRKLRAAFIPQREWQEVEFFDNRWKERIQAMARFIAPGQAVLDLGCGPMWVRNFLPPGCDYVPCDYIDRGPGTIVCDFNQGQFPDTKADVTFVSGCLEYVEAVDWFVGRLATAAPRCIIAYCIVTTDSSLVRRKKNAWKNHLTEEELMAVFARHGMRCVEQGGKKMSSYIYCFDRVQNKER